MSAPETQSCEYCERVIDRQDPELVRVQLLRAHDGDDYWNDFLSLTFCSETHVKPFFAERDLPPLEVAEIDDGRDFGAFGWAFGLLVVLPSFAIYGLVSLILQLT